jgi:hypothetical protein
MSSCDTKKYFKTARDQDHSRSLTPKHQHIRIKAIIGVTGLMPDPKNFISFQFHMFNHVLIKKHL